MPRFFVEARFIKESRLNITGREARHIATVLRLESGDMISVFDNSGKEYAVLIERSAPSRVEGRIIQEKTVEKESPVEITLFQGLPKSSKMDFIVEKCTELGVHRIVPIITSRTVPKVDPEKMESRRSRWERIAREASKQSGRINVPEIGSVTTFQDALSGEMDLKLIPWEDERSTTIKSALRKCDVAYPFHIGVFIGPEGGFTRDEIGQARHSGAISVSLGRRVLKTETAGVVASAIILYELEPDIRRMDYGSDN